MLLASFLKGLDTHQPRLLKTLLVRTVNNINLKEETCYSVIISKSSESLHFIIYKKSLLNNTREDCGHVMSKTSLKKCLISAYMWDSLLRVKKILR